MDEDGMEEGKGSDEEELEKVEEGYSKWSCKSTTKYFEIEVEVLIKA
jgi:hypothetical protein